MNRNRFKWAARVSKENRPAILNERHKDWPWLFRWVPRSWTAWFGPPPQMVAGNAEVHAFFYQWNGTFWQPCDPELLDIPEEHCFRFSHPLPIPEPGQWWRGTPRFFASKDKDGTYVRHGMRWDNIDGYYNWPSFTIKQYTVNAIKAVTVRPAKFVGRKFRFKMDK